MAVAPPTRLDRTSDFVPEDAARQLELRSYRQMGRLVGRAAAQPLEGRGTSAVLVPGFISGDIAMNMMSRYLRRRGHRTFRSGIGANLGCTDVVVDRLIRRLEIVAETEGRPVVLVGHSRGGMIVALTARRRPDLVSGVVVLSAPVTGTLAVAPHVRKQLEVLFRLNRRGLRGVISEDCVTGECAERVARSLESPFPTSVPYTSVYSRADAIIDWHTCLDPAAEQIEVGSSHSGMGTDRTVLRIVADRLDAMAVSRP